MIGNKNIFFFFIKIPLPVRASQPIWHSPFSWASVLLWPVMKISVSFEIKWSLFIQQPCSMRHKLQLSKYVRIIEICHHCYSPGIIIFTLIILYKCTRTQNSHRKVLSNDISFGDFRDRIDVGKMKL